MNYILNKSNSDILNAALQSEVSKTEHLLWSAQPDPRRMLRVFSSWLISVPWTGGVIYTAYQLFLFNQRGLVIYFTGFLLMLGIWWLTKPLWALSDARHTIHALTDKRLITLTKRKAIKVNALALERAEEVDSFVEPDGWGRISIRKGSYRGRNGSRIIEKFEFLGIPDVAKVKLLLQEAKQAQLKSQAAA